MARIWANRLEAGTQVWSAVPAVRREAVKAVLRQDAAAGRITAEQYQTITGEPYRKATP